MDDFETFKASREKIDPSSRKFSDRQWSKAYAAYRSSRERVSEARNTKSDDSSRRRRSGRSESPTPKGSAHSPVANLRNEVRQNSAYSDLRMILDFLAWIAIGVVVLTAGVKLAYYTDGSVSLAALLDSVLKVLGIVALRLLVHVIIDIPDIALYHRLTGQGNTRNEQATPED